INDPVLTLFPLEREGLSVPRGSSLAMLRYRTRAGRRAVPGAIVGEALDAVQIPSVAARRRAAPGEMTVVSVAEDGASEDEAALHAILGAFEMGVVPERRRRQQGHVRIVGDDRGTRRRPARGHCPIVASGGGQMQRRFRLGAVTDGVCGRGVL